MNSEKNKKTCTDEVSDILEQYDKKIKLPNTPDQYFFIDKIKVIETINKGIPYSFFNRIQDYSPFTESEWATLLSISTKSLQRYKSTENYRFKPLQSEKIIAMTEVTKAGMDLFGNIDKFKEWLNTPSYALGNLKPMELLSSSYGKELVMDELIRLNQGILV
ncbi:Hypothetical protein PSM36_1371 [Proteiniphilum saccharofermentans]|uniref:Uncharacterized protein n=2 Tax=Proteiniphilum saccharofermentans TaxID=1642647 RepID=A0A1R3SV50_9BACT|nr:Hypothetical protein PSM36_1371 [Proteiniphilum saccharofermentans]